MTEPMAAADIPAGWRPDESILAYGVKMGLSEAELEFEAMVDFAGSLAVQSTDWNATWLGFVLCLVYQKQGEEQRAFRETGKITRDAPEQ